MPHMYVHTFHSTLSLKDSPASFAQALTIVGTYSKPE